MASFPETRCIRFMSSLEWWCSPLWHRFARLLGRPWVRTYAPMDDQVFQACTFRVGMKITVWTGTVCIVVNGMRPMIQY